MIQEFQKLFGYFLIMIIFQKMNRLINIWVLISEQVVQSDLIYFIDIPTVKVFIILHQLIQRYGEVSFTDIRRVQ